MSLFLKACSTIICREVPNGGPHGDLANQIEASLERALSVMLVLDDGTRSERQSAMEELERLIGRATFGFEDVLEAAVRQGCDSARGVQLGTSQIADTQRRVVDALVEFDRRVDALV